MHHFKTKKDKTITNADRIIKNRSLPVKKRHKGVAIILDRKSKMWFTKSQGPPSYVAKRYEGSKNTSVKSKNVRLIYTYVVRIIFLIRIFLFLFLYIQSSMCTIATAELSKPTTNEPVLRFALCSMACLITLNSFSPNSFPFICKDFRFRDLVT